MIKAAGVGWWLEQGKWNLEGQKVGGVNMNFK